MANQAPRNKEELKHFLDAWVEKTNVKGFIQHDPITIPHRFTKQQDIEIAGFFAAIMAWGNRQTIINKCGDLLQRMDNAPHDFVLNHSDREARVLKGFVHRTLNETDVLFILDFFKRWYRANESLEQAFTQHMTKGDNTVETGLNGFYSNVFSTQWPSERTRKHIAAPHKKSACKRLNMFLRWMVRNDGRGVDFGLWRSISTSQLICPLDVHVQRVAHELGLLARKQADWKAAVELTNALREFDARDPVRYDFALFGLGLSGFPNKKGSH
ncbi:MAG: TIGR02757 family protein [Bacteroidia bacterium]|nr:TIGR02757 family protein [Bacteroidia bacterium]